jgi:hypothetical protein
MSPSASGLITLSDNLAYPGGQIINVNAPWSAKGLENLLYNSGGYFTPLFGGEALKVVGKLYTNLESIWQLTWDTPPPFCAAEVAEQSCRGDVEGCSGCTC